MGLIFLWDNNLRQLFGIIFLQKKKKYLRKVHIFFELNLVIFARSVPRVSVEILFRQISNKMSGSEVFI